MPAAVLHHEPAGDHHTHSKQCKSVSCSSHHKIWRSIQETLQTGDREALSQLCQDSHRIEGVKKALLVSRASNDPRQYPPSHKHRILQFDKTVRPDAESLMGKSMTDLNSIQVAIFHRREVMACQMLSFLRHTCQPLETQLLVNHLAGGGNSALHLAAFLAMPRLVRLLLDMGADPTVENVRHLTPAECSKDTECVAALEQAIADGFERAPRRLSRTGSRRSSLKQEPTKTVPAVVSRPSQVPAKARAGIAFTSPRLDRIATVTSLPMAPVVHPLESATLVPAAETTTSSTRDSTSTDGHVSSALESSAPDRKPAEPVSSVSALQHDSSTGGAMATCDWPEDLCLAPCLDGLLLDASSSAPAASIRYTADTAASTPDDPSTTNNSRDNALLLLPPEDPTVSCQTMPPDLCVSPDTISDNTWRLPCDTDETCLTGPAWSVCCRSQQPTSPPTCQPSGHRVENHDPPDDTLLPCHRRMPVARDNPPVAGTLPPPGDPGTSPKAIPDKSSDHGNDFGFGEPWCTERDPDKTQLHRMVALLVLAAQYHLWLGKGNDIASNALAIASVPLGHPWHASAHPLATRNRPRLVC